MKESGILVSVIIPCCNSKNYIERCLTSLKNQTYKNIEAIVVDDCSSDGTPETVFKLNESLGFPIKILKNDGNIGPSLSRRRGVLASSGDFICFCDSDDWYDDTFVEKMLSSLIDNGADIVFCGHKVVNEKNKIERRELRFKSQPTTKNESLVIDCDSLCMAMMKKGVINDVDVPDIRNGEDAALVPVLIQKASKIYLISDCLYNYFRRKDSASQLPKASIIDSLNESFEFIREHLPKNYRFEIEYLGIRNLLYPAEITLFSISYNRKAGLDQLRAFESAFPKWHKNKLINRLPFYKRLVLILLRFKAFLLVRLIALIRLKKTS